MRRTKNIKRLRVLAGILMMLILALPLASCGNSSAGSEKSSGDAAVKSIGEFTTADMNGNEVTQDVFSKADLTVLNFWGTYCPPCIQEMPELQEIADEGAEKNVQVIGVMVDVDVSQKDSGSYASAVRITEKQGVKFTNIQPTDSLIDLMSTLYGVPTTFFVDSEGNIIGEPVVGANASAYRKAIDAYLEGKES